ncbi:Adenylate isopentenyltransferase [Quillaja saponaria]|uniref:adenylate dimethylallyltransferase (ADP/ATP-dependent) n=1 Tax=Quillaja saponaria TaxID=32244 RepID=A0AAD7QCM7_QUISA|nr:Adenylate isopentenyltransferase [Quillaja saponaria]
MTTINKKKVVFIMGCTGTGKSKLSVDVGTQFPSEIINSDKIQVYKGLDIITNKIPEPKRHGVPHHLLGIIDDPDMDYAENDFCQHVLEALDMITENGHLPIIVGGSNRYLEALVEDPKNEFRSKYDSCFIWLDVSLPVLFDYLSKRVDEMVEGGLIEEVREAFVHEADYSKGIRRAIGLPELHKYFQAEKELVEDGEIYKEDLLRDCIQEMKDNTNKLAALQLRKIHKLREELGWEMHRIDGTKVFETVLSGKLAENVWDEIVLKPSLGIVRSFLNLNVEE